MKAVGIICEYNPFHLGHAGHIEMTRQAHGGNCGVVCVMSGNFVQRGDFAVFGKHARAEAAVSCGADLVLELPSPYSLSAVAGFASAGVYLLDSLGICDCISFGSESGDISELSEASEAIVAPEADTIIRESLDKGLPYASAQQKAADAVLGARSVVFKSPNNLLGIEYLKAVAKSGSSLKAMTFRRVGGDHDGAAGLSAWLLREKLLSERQGDVSSVLAQECRGAIPLHCAKVLINETEAGRGPVSMKACELAMLSRLRATEDFSSFPGASEGLDKRFLRFCKTEPTIAGILEKVKTKRYAMSRLRRLLICACLGISADDLQKPPSYIRVLAMNRAGMMLLKAMRGKASLPVITKPASALKLSGDAGKLFSKEASATDFYALGYPNENARTGGQEWRTSPVVLTTAVGSCDLQS